MLRFKFTDIHLFDTGVFKHGLKNRDFQSRKKMEIQILYTNLQNFV